MVSPVLQVLADLEGAALVCDCSLSDAVHLQSIGTQWVHMQATLPGVASSSYRHTCLESGKRRFTGGQTREKLA